MTDSETIEAADLERLTEQLWRRLGITQTFDKLLVSEVATAPGSADEVRGRIAGQLTGGASKFWDLSFPKLQKDLARRQVISDVDGTLRLDDDFQARLVRIIASVDEGDSLVAPTPGVTLEDVMAKVKAREAHSKPSRPRPAAGPRPAKGAAPKPKKRAGKQAESEDLEEGEAGEVTPRAPSPRAPAAPRPAPARTPSTPLNKLFTTMKLNRLLDALDNSQTLLRSQLGTRLELGQRDLARFLAVTDALDVTRDLREDLVSLHWKGQELSRTASADRRMALIELVKTLRTEAEKLEG